MNSTGRIRGLMAAAAIVGGVALFVATIACQGAGWSAQNSGTNKELVDVCFADAQNGWVLAMDGAILHTTDGGATWAIQREADESFGFGAGAIQFMKSKIGYVGYAVGNDGMQGAILRTLNGGTTWEMKGELGEPRMFLSGLHFINLGYGWAVGGAGIVLRTKDGGATWEEIGHAPSQGLDSVFFVNKTNGFAVGPMELALGNVHSGSVVSGSVYGGMLLRTVDGGATWTIVLNNKEGTGYRGYYNSVFFADAKNGWVVGPSDILLRTTDGGATWTAIAATGKKKYTTLSDIRFIDAKLGWAVGQADDGGGLVIQTKDGGATWKVQLEGFPTKLLNSVFFIDANKGWAVGDEGTIIATTTGGE